MPEVFNVALLEHAHEDGAVYGSKAVGEPPLMLAFSVREALRQAAAAFGPAGTSVDLASPATPEAVCWAIEQARAAAPSPSSRGPRARARAAGADRPLLHPRSEHAARSVPVEGGRDALDRGRRAAAPRAGAGRAGHRSPTYAGTHRARPAPRWSSPRRDTWGSVGGGNLEETAVARARAPLEPAATSPSR